MPEHRYEKADLIHRFDDILNKTLEEVDDKGLFEHVREEGFRLQKGIAGAVVEQCVLGYEPDTRQEADLVVVDHGNETKTELKVTGMRTDDTDTPHFVAKEPMSITAVGIYDIADQSFPDSHFWNKLEHMLVVYYHYLSDTSVPPYDYKDFPIKGYEFHEFSEADEEALRQDWSFVHQLCAEIVSAHPGPRDSEWREAVKQEYIDRHGYLRRLLSYIDLAPKFPPRFRLKKSTVDMMISRHFGYELEQLPGRFTTVSDIDAKCEELTQLFAGRAIGDIADELGVPRLSRTGRENKGIAEQVLIKMFGGGSEKLNQVELFRRFGIIAKTVAVTPSGGRTEDMKFFQIDFGEMTQETYVDEDGLTRPFAFEDSELYTYFADHEFLCILFEEPAAEYMRDPVTGRFLYDPISHRRIKVRHPLAMNRFLGFRRLVFSDEFIDTAVRRVWDDTRYKIFSRTLEDVIQRDSRGHAILLSNGEVSSAPSFMKSAQNDVFIRGSAQNSSIRYKTECVNGIRMIPQFIWVKGTAIVNELRLNVER